MEPDNPARVILIGDFIAGPCRPVTLLAAVQAAIEAGSGSTPSQEASVSRLRYGTVTVTAVPQG
jgi:hypothetical protein